MTIPTAPTSEVDLAALASEAKSRYAALLAGSEGTSAWWSAIVLTASSARQAQHCTNEIARRTAAGQLPGGTRYLVVPDLEGERLGSAGATFNALRCLAEVALPGSSARSLLDWWATQRVLIIHSGGDSRRLPQYSLAGKLFSLLPFLTPWGSPSTLFDEFIALSTTWAQQLVAGLVVSSGDVLLTFDASGLNWQRPGVSGVAIRQPLEVGMKHGIYTADGAGRVCSFLQKPTEAQVREAGALCPDGTVALDTGLLYFDPALSARFTALAGAECHGERWATGEGLLVRHAGTRPHLGLYEHLTLALTGQYKPDPGSHPALSQMVEALCGVPFWCDVVPGQFAHVGTTRLFRQLLTGQLRGTGASAAAADFLRRHEAQPRFDEIAPPRLRSAGVIVDSVLAGGGEIGAGALAIECRLHTPVYAGNGAILHGLTELPGPVVVPEDLVAHQVPVLLPDGRTGTVIRVYGVGDDPKDTVVSGQSTWMGRPILDVLAELGKSEAEVWGDLPTAERTLWNARLFPVGTVDEVWTCARWLMGVETDEGEGLWERLGRLSLAESAQWADPQALAAARQQRQEAQWQATAMDQAIAGADLRPLLAHAPWLAPVAATGRALRARAAGLSPQAPTEAASQYLQASILLSHAGLVPESEEAKHSAFATVRQAVDAGSYPDLFANRERRWSCHEVRVAAAARLDLGGGWSDTPPFCLDWGGTVLNLAIALDGQYPIRTTLRRVPEPLIRCISEDAGEVVAEYRCTEEILAPPGPGCPFAIQRAALAMTGLVRPERPLAEALAASGGGLEICTAVDLPMGSGLGTSSILAVTILQALAAMTGDPLEMQELNEQVLRLEQCMTTGGGWQDQAGAIYPGAKLITSGPGLRQRLRVAPLTWSAERQAEFADRFLLYYTGLQRIARDLLTQVVRRYLARESAPLQVLHSIKSLAIEMAQAMNEGEWAYLGELLDRHWHLNQVLDPNTTNAPIEALLETARPYLAGAKLAGAGGGGFLLLLARSPEAAGHLRECLSNPEIPGRLHDWSLAREGLRLELRP